jgi:phage-related minor tail protein
MADGGAFQGGTQFFADGGVVNTPTSFGMANGGTGVMGEAGPEAIMPLTRGADGKLGVRSQGGGGQAAANNNTYNLSVSIGSVDSAERQAELLKALDQQMRATAKQTMANEMRQGGMLNRRTV